MFPHAVLQDPGENRAQAVPESRVEEGMGRAEKEAETVESKGKGAEILMNGAEGQKL